MICSKTFRIQNDGMMEYHQIPRMLRVRMEERDVFSDQQQTYYVEYVFLGYASAGITWHRYEVLSF